MSRIRAGIFYLAHCLFGVFFIDPYTHFMWWSIFYSSQVLGQPPLNPSLALTCIPKSLFSLLICLIRNGTQPETLNGQNWFHTCSEGHRSGWKISYRVGCLCVEVLLTLTSIGSSFFSHSRINWSFNYYEKAGSIGKYLVKLDWGRLPWLV